MGNTHQLIDFIDLEHEELLIYNFNGLSHSLFNQLYSTE